MNVQRNRKCLNYGTRVLIVYLLVQVAKSSSAENDLEDLRIEGSSKQQGSWSQWWSYDGISGPDYWNINKQWRLCSLGRKQSPIEVRTDRLVYDHLLGPIQLTWLPASVTSYDDVTLRKYSQKTAHEEKTPVKLRLLNSGRGVEAWLESASSASGLGQQEQLVLSRGPLSYAYKLFKIELHSATNGLSGTSGTVGGSGSLADSQQQQPPSPMVSRSSEHLIDGRAFDAEVQLHFYNKQLASSAAEAQQLANDESRPHLFAAISVFVALVEVLPNHSPSSDQKTTKSATSGQIDFILDNLGAIQNEGDSVGLQLTKDRLDALITDRRHYVTYQGSLNRPPCAETVEWILLNKAIRVNRTKFEMSFEKLNTNQDNNRPIRPLNRRLLRTTINIDGQSGKDETGSSVEDEDDTSEMSIETSGETGRQKSCRLGSAGDKNCSNVTGAGTYATQRASDAGRRKGFGSCSMKPNYAYQLSFNKH